MAGISWDMSEGKPLIWNYNKDSGSYEHAYPTWFTWQTVDEWVLHDACLRGVNNTGQPIKITKVGIQSCSCHSGGQQYIEYGGQPIGPSWGTGARGYCYVRVNNGSGWEKSSTGYHNVSQLVVSNMNYPGSPGGGTAQFGRPPYGTPAAAPPANRPEYGLLNREYVVATPVIIQPGKAFYIHLGFDSFTQGQSSIDFLLDPSAMVIDIEPGYNPYVWQYKASEGKWHLKMPIQLYSKLPGHSTPTWHDIEGE